MNPLAMRPAKPRNVASGRITVCTGKRKLCRESLSGSGTVSRCSSRVGPWYHGIRLLRSTTLSPSSALIGTHWTSAIPSWAASARKSSCRWRKTSSRFSARGREIPVSHVDGDALLTFGTQTIGEQRKIDRPRGAVDAALLHRSELIFVDGLGIVQETPDQRRLAVVDATSRGEAKKLGVQVVLKKSREGVMWAVLRGRNHQKYPSRFLSSMEPSSS